MDENMQRHSVRLRGLTLAAASIVLATGAAKPQVPESHAHKYCNAKYMYCVDVPSSGKTKPHEGDSPNHGVTVDLGDSSYAWTYGEWDAALLGSSEKAALRRRRMLLDELPSAEAKIVQGTMDG